MLAGESNLMATETQKFLFDNEERIFLESSSPMPLYHQMEQLIHDRIVQEDAIGTMLPAEKNLMEIFGVSRATVKKALENLVAKGLLQRRRAVGTRVIRQEITETLARLSSYTEEMEGKGIEVRTEVLELTVRVPDDEVRERLQLKEDEKTLFLKRLRGTSEVFPFVLLQSELPNSLGIDLNEDFTGSLYRILERKYKTPIKWADEEIRARDATPEEADCLGLEPGDTVLVMERLAHTWDDRPVELVRGVYRPEHYKFSIRLWR